MKATYNKSEIMKKAWKEYKNVRRIMGYSFAWCLRSAWGCAKSAIELAAMKNEVVEETGWSLDQAKSFLTGSLRFNAWLENSKKGVIEMKMDIIARVEMLNVGLASDIAASVLKYQNCSEKQAYHIAKAAVENGLV